MLLNRTVCVLESGELRDMILFNMEKCYNYFDWKQTECVVLQKKDQQPCWETEGTLCFFTPLTPIVPKEINQNEKCDFCLYKDNMLKQA